MKITPLPYDPNLYPQETTPIVQPETPTDEQIIPEPEEMDEGVLYVEESMNEPSSQIPNDPFMTNGRWKLFSRIPSPFLPER